jgi:hypothetical protein
MCICMLILVLRLDMCFVLEGINNVFICVLALSKGVSPIHYILIYSNYHNVLF